MFRVKEIVKTSGKGRTADWPEQVGTVTGVTAGSVFVQWHDCAVETEMNYGELVSTGAFNDIVSAVVADLPPPRRSRQRFTKPYGQGSGWAPVRSRVRASGSFSGTNGRQDATVTAILQPAKNGR